MDEHAMSHYSAEAFVDYVDMRLSDEEELAMEAHFAECTQCTALAREARDIAVAWNTCSPRTHGEAYLAMVVHRAITAAHTSVRNPAWQDRLTRWVERWAGTTEA